MQKSYHLPMLEADLARLLEALTTLSMFNIPIPARLNFTIHAYREQIQRHKEHTRS